ncbi:unnamed protein product [Caenorhabditis brenneri]
MKEEPMEDMEDASNVPFTSGMATLPVEKFIKEERVHEMEELWYAPPRPPRPFNWTTYPPVPFFESQNVNLDDISDQEDGKRKQLSFQNNGNFHRWKMLHLPQKRLKRRRPTTTATTITKTATTCSRQRCNASP